MKPIYTVIKSHIQKQVSNGMLLTKNTAVSTLANIVERRLVHWHAKNSGSTTVLDTLSVSHAEKSTILSSIKQLSDHTPPGNVVVQGSLRDLTMSDWLDVEQALIIARLRQGNTLKIPLSTLQAGLRTSTEFPILFRNHIPIKRDMVAISLGAFVLSFIAGLLFIAISLAFDVDRTLVNAVGNILSVCLILSMQCIAASLSWLNFKSRWDVLNAARAGLSTNWDDVLNMKTFEDAILTGMLAHRIHYLQQARVDLPLPDFLAHTPSEVFDFLFATANTKHNSQVAQTIRTHVEADAAGPNVVSGLSFDNLVEGQCDVPCIQVKIENNTESYMPSVTNKYTH